MKKSTKEKRYIRKKIQENKERRQYLLDHTNISYENSEGKQVEISLKEYIGIMEIEKKIACVDCTKTNCEKCTHRIKIKYN